MLQGSEAMPRSCKVRCTVYMCGLAPAQSLLALRCGHQLGLHRGCHLHGLRVRQPALQPRRLPPLLGRLRLRGQLLLQLHHLLPTAPVSAQPVGHLLQP